jgi:hypothetical protein
MAKEMTGADKAENLGILSKITGFGGGCHLLKFPN